MYVVSYKEREEDVWHDSAWNDKYLALLFAGELLLSGFILFITEMEV